MAEMKICNVCEQELNITDFYFRKESGKYRNNCKQCKPLLRKADIIAKAHSETKVCKDCGKEKLRECFHKAGGGCSQPYCKECDSKRKINWQEQNKERLISDRKKSYIVNRDLLRQKAKEYHIRTAEERRAYQKKYRQQNPELYKERHAKYIEREGDALKERVKQKRKDNPEYYRAKDKALRDKKTPEQKLKEKEYKREYRIKNIEKIKGYEEITKERKRENRRIWCNNKSATDISFRILKNLRSRTRFALKKDGAVKSAATENLLGCTIPEFRAYFESLFIEGMSWDLFMQGGIHIDHKRPCTLYDLTDEAQQRDCFFYKNLQPLLALDNLKKSSKYEECLQ